MAREITITVTVPVHGIHCWKNAPDEVAYLRDTHRHVFYIRPTVVVMHDDRDVEFHMLQQKVSRFVRDSWPRTKGGTGHDFGEMSCEMLAREVGTYLQAIKIQVKSVSVSEDDECFAEVCW